MSPPMNTSFAIPAPPSTTSAPVDVLVDCVVLFRLVAPVTSSVPERVELPATPNVPSMAALLDTPKVPVTFAPVEDVAILSALS